MAAVELRQLTGFCFYWFPPSAIMRPAKTGTAMTTETTLSRDIAIDPKQTALLFIDVQNFAAKREGAEFKEMSADTFESQCGWFFRQLESTVIPNMQRLQKAARKAKVEVM